MSTYFPKLGEIARKWYVVDADGQTLGRLATRVAMILTGKNSPRYTPFLDTGDHVIVINAGKVRLTGLKAEAEVVSPLHGSIPAACGKKNITDGLPDVRTSWCRTAVEGMLPKTKLGARWRKS